MNTIQEVKPEEFEKMCENHDWYYMNSDDLLVWEKANNEDKTLMKLANKNKTLFDIFYKHKNKYRS